MRLLTFDDNGQARVGIRRADTVIDLSAAAPKLPNSIRGLLQAGGDILEQVQAASDAAPAQAVRPLDQIRYLPPVPNPSKILCLGLNYADHAAEGGHAKPQYPSFFMRGPSSLIAHNEAIRVPKVCHKLDYEAELAVIIGTRARHLRGADALSVIAGYSAFNDGSIRPYQRKTSQWTIGKNFDATGGFGPELVTSDELPPGATGLSIRTRLNGNVMQNANTADMLFDVAYTIELLTECMTLEPGDVIITGTPQGVGHARNPQVWMQPGDRCEVEIEGVGLLVNPIAAET